MSYLALRLSFWVHEYHQRAIMKLNTWFHLPASLWLITCHRVKSAYFGQSCVSVCSHRLTILNGNYCHAHEFNNMLLPMCAPNPIEPLFLVSEFQGTSKVIVSVDRGMSGMWYVETIYGLTKAQSFSMQLVQHEMPWSMSSYEDNRPESCLPCEMHRPENPA